MASIFTFSLDGLVDKDIINRLEGMKNRSRWIRRMLRRELDNEVMKLQLELVYEAYKHQMQMRYTIPTPDKPRNPQSLYVFREQAMKKWANIQRSEEE